MNLTNSQESVVLLNKYIQDAPSTREMFKTKKKMNLMKKMLKQLKDENDYYKNQNLVKESSSDQNQLEDQQRCIEELKKQLEEKDKYAKEQIELTKILITNEKIEIIKSHESKIGQLMSKNKRQEKGLQKYQDAIKNNVSRPEILAVNERVLEETNGLPCIVC